MSRKKNRKAVCHKNRPHYALGLCRNCYHRKHFREAGGRKRKIGICARCKKTVGIAGKGKCHTCYCIVRKEKVKIPLLKRQKNKCAVKGCTTDTQKYILSDWQLDHDHECCNPGNFCAKCVRGVVCKPCNRILGYVADSTERLTGLILYLEKR